MLTEKEAPIAAPRQPLLLGLALSAVTMAQIASAFAIQWYTVAQLGAGPETDAFYAGFTLPQIVMVVAIDPLGFVLVPMLAVTQASERKIAGSLLFWFVGVASVLITLLLILLLPLIVPFLVPGFSEATTQLTIKLARIQVIGVVGAACMMVLSSLYHAGQQFIRPALWTLVWTLVGWLILVVGIQERGVSLAAWVQVLCSIGPMLSLAPSIGWLGRSEWLTLGANVRELWRRLKPLMVSAAYYRTGFLVDRFLASLLAPGSVVVLELAWRFHLALVRILNQGLTTPILPVLARLSHQGAWRDFRRQYRRRLLWILLVSLPAVGGLAAAALLTREYYYNDGGGMMLGVISSPDVNKLVLALIGSSGILLCGSINHLMMSAFYAHGDMRTPTRIQMLSYSIGIVMKCCGFVLGGLMGIALAMSLYYALEGLLLGTVLHRRMAVRLYSEIAPVLEFPAVNAPPRPL
jgi:peptidoglycan biosynthesis protein MviN/MurJ (putative lipid II flippase)